MKCLITNVLPDDQHSTIPLLVVIVLVLPRRRLDYRNGDSSSCMVDSGTCYVEFAASVLFANLSSPHSLGERCTGLSCRWRVSDRTDTAWSEPGRRAFGAEKMVRGDGIKCSLEPIRRAMRDSLAASRHAVSGVGCDLHSIFRHDGRIQMLSCSFGLMK